jgi:prepilin-type N-terminal cleavage/methylation domain-containing protein
MTSSATRTSGFTLIEILVSIAIFLVVSVAMVTVLFLSTELFRQGEFSRSASDESITVLGTIENDLKRMLPPADGGFIYSKVLSDGSGNCLVAFSIRREITRVGDAQQQLVVYWVDSTVDRNLHRHAYDLVGTSADNDTTVPLGGTLPNGVKEQARRLNESNTTEGVILTKGCLYLGAWFANQFDYNLNRPVLQTDFDPDWENVGNNGYVNLPPTGTPFDTDPTSPAVIPDQFPSALRISITLTGGGRFGPKGTLATNMADATAQFSIVGVKAIPTVPGSCLKIGNEWIAYSDVNKGLITCDASRPNAGRGFRRSTATAHTRPAEVFFGRTYNLIRTLSR